VGREVSDVDLRIPSRIRRVYRQAVFAERSGSEEDKIHKPGVIVHPQFELLAIE
jgi:hypothetical protein